MTLPTHALLGFIIGKVTGDYSLAVASSVLPDIDHFQSYIKSGLILKPSQLWSALIDQKDPYGDQRGILHNIIFFVVVNIPIVLLGGFVITLGWLGHIFLDAIDKSDYWPLYPNKKINLKGFIPYASIWELIFFFSLVIVYFLI
jgi:membrane-bound metal-dependent hydrolase YbcI (DUF457 family)